MKIIFAILVGMALLMGYVVYRSVNVTTESEHTQKSFRPAKIKGNSKIILFECSGRETMALADTNRRISRKKSLPTLEKENMLLNEMK